MSNSNDWSFSLCDDSLELFDTIAEGDDDNDTTVHTKSDNSCSGNKCTPLNQYNPFILTKMNYFKRKHPKAKLKVFDKKIKVKTLDIIKNLETASLSELNWDFTCNWFHRKGFPSEVLKEGFCNRVINSENYKFIKSKLSHEGWFIATTTKKKKANTCKLQLKTEKSTKN